MHIHCRLIAILAALGCLGGCAAARSDAGRAVASAAPAGPGGTGVIVAMRMEETRPDARSARDRILRVVGGAAAARGDRAAVEFIVRSDDGRTISVMQENEGQLQPGERVILAPGARTRIARAGTAR